MTRGRKIAIGLASLLVVAAGAAYLWPGYLSQPTQQAQRGPTGVGGGFGPKGPFGPGGPKGAFRPGGPNDPPVPVLATSARVADVPVYLDGVGTARALNTVTVRPQVDGKLIGIGFAEGQDVQRGDVLARIDPSTYQAQLDQALAKKAQDEAQLANARLDLERFNRLAATNAATKQQADTAQAQVNQLEALMKVDQALIDNARAVLGYTTITAPISGRTGIRLVDEGNLVRASDPNGLVVITQLRPISVFFSLPQQSLQQVNRGMTLHGSLRVDALTSDTATIIDTGKLVVVDNQVDQTTGTVRLKTEFPNADLQLWPGQFVNMRLLIDTLRQVIVVPTAAVQRGPDGTFVFVVRDNNTVTVRPVTVSQQNDVQTVIAQGLQAGERVVTAGFSRLAEGTRVRPTAADEQGREQPGALQSQDRPPPQRDRRRPQQKSGALPAAPGVPSATASTTGSGATP